MIQKRNELENLQERMNGLVFDIEYGVEAVKDVGTSDEHIKVNNKIRKTINKRKFILEYYSIFR